ncbi:hypothetical protein ACP4OV_008494 [Aristida adscensionis]
MAVGASDFVFRPRDDQLVALLRRLLAGDDGGSSFVHCADVYAAAPEDLVGDLEPAPGTAQGDGHGSVWYFFCAKKYKSAHAKPGGKRHRAVGAGEACWHSEAGPKDVVGPDGDLVVGHFVKFSYGCKTAAPVKFNRLGWCMTEYSLGDKNAAAAAADGEYVLCKVYRSPRAKGKSSVSASSTSAASTSFGAKRKATGDHPEARATKSSFQQGKGKQILSAGDSQDRQDYDNMFQEEQPRAAPESNYGETMVQTAFGLLPSVVAEVTFDELFCPSTSGACSGLPASAPPPEADFFDGLFFPSGACSDMPASAPPLDADFFDGLSFPAGESSSLATSAPPPPDADFFDGLSFASGACSAPPPGPEFFEGLPACFSC